VSLRNSSSIEQNPWFKFLFPEFKRFYPSTYLFLVCDFALARHWCVTSFCWQCVAAHQPQTEKKWGERRLLNSVGEWATAPHRQSFGDKVSACDKIS